MFAARGMVNARTGYGSGGASSSSSSSSSGGYGSSNLGHMPATMADQAATKLREMTLGGRGYVGSGKNLVAEPAPKQFSRLEQHQTARDITLMQFPTWILLPAELQMCQEIDNTMIEIMDLVDSGNARYDVMRDERELLVDLQGWMPWSDKTAALPMDPKARDSSAASSSSGASVKDKGDAKSMSLDSDEASNDVAMDSGKDEKHDDSKHGDGIADSDTDSNHHGERMTKTAPKFFMLVATNEVLYAYLRVLPFVFERGINPADVGQYFLCDNKTIVSDELIERKEKNDLSNGIKGEAQLYEKQKYRLGYYPIARSRITYMIENGRQRYGYCLTDDAIESAIAKIVQVEGMNVRLTSSVLETVYAIVKGVYIKLKHGSRYFDFMYGGGKPHSYGLDDDYVATDAKIPDYLLACERDRNAAAKELIEVVQAERAREEAAQKVAASSSSAGGSSSSSSSSSGESKKPWNKNMVKRKQGVILTPRAILEDPVMMMAMQLMRVVGVRAPLGLAIARRYPTMPHLVRRYYEIAKETKNDREALALMLHNDKIRYTPFTGSTRNKFVYKAVKPQGKKKTKKKSDNDDDASGGARPLGKQISRDIFRLIYMPYWEESIKKQGSAHAEEVFAEAAAVDAKLAAKKAKAKEAAAARKKKKQAEAAQEEMSHATATDTTDTSSSTMAVEASDKDAKTEAKNTSKSSKSSGKKRKLQLLAADDGDTGSSAAPTAASSADDSAATDPPAPKRAKTKRKVIEDDDDTAEAAIEPKKDTGVGQLVFVPRAPSENKKRGRGKSKPQAKPRKRKTTNTEFD